MTHEPQHAISQDERMLACASHLAFLGGFWLLGPIIAYAWKGKESRFVAFHSAQAIVLALLMGAVGFLGIVVAFVAMFAIGATMQDAPRAAPMAMMTIVYGTMFAFAALPTILSLVAGVRALQGHWWRVPLVSRIAEAFAGKHGPSP